MIAVDTNLLVYAHRADAAEHAAALPVLRGLAEGRARWALPWPCIHEFIAIVTHSRGPGTLVRAAGYALDGRVAKVHGTLRASA